MPKLRRLKLRTLDEAAAEIVSLRNGGYTKGGNWNLSQVCRHLDETMRVELDGTMKPLPWIVRATVGNVIFWLLASRILPAPRGLPTLKELTPEPAERDDEQAIDRCLQSCRRAGEVTELEHTYPLATSVTADRWREMMTVHAQHHLEFLKPSAESA